MNETQIKEVLKNSKTIAMIGVSSEKKGEDKNNLKRKPANVVMKYMQDFGYKVYQINPFAIGETINGETVIGSLDDIEEDIDILDVFRPSKEALNIAKEAIKGGNQSKASKAKQRKASNQAKQASKQAKQASKHAKLATQS